MTTELVEIAGWQCLVMSDDDAVVQTAQDALDLVGDALSDGATVIVLPVAAVDRAFFELRSGLAGEIVQKLVNYRMKLAIIGDIAAYVAASNAFRDFVIECERNHQVLFEPDMDALAKRLDRLAETKAS